jgi:hypothetical protein
MCERRRVCIYHTRRTPFIIKQGQIESHQLDADAHSVVAGVQQHVGIKCFPNERHVHAAVDASTVVGDVARHSAREGRQADVHRAG